jgi:hypothetical protein
MEPQRISEIKASLLNMGTDELQTMSDNLSDLIWKDKVEENEAVDLVYTVLFHKGTTGDKLVFGPFIDDNRGRNQRVYLKVICQEIKKKIQQK